MDTLLYYIQSGFQHVLPLGYDHVLFILALFFLNSELKTAIIQCSIFTIAHSLTLGMVAMGYLQFNSQMIECLIALSIFFVAIENLLQSELKWWRLLIVFAFGLIHGMGFASALATIGIPENELVPALLGFNIGVELAQVSIILFCYFFIAKWMRDKVWYQLKFVHPLSLVISCIALFWAIDRYLS